MPTDNLTHSPGNQGRADKLLNLSGQTFRALMSRPWLLGYILVIQAAFQGVIIAHWGIVGNILTLAICCLFLMAVYVQTRNTRDLAHAVLGTRTQRLAALFVLSLVITMIWGNHSYQAFLSLGQKITFLLIMAVVIDTMRRKEALTPFAWVVSGSVTLLFILMLIEYYSGIDLTMLDEQWHVPHDFCKGINHVRMAHLTIDNLYGTNRLAFYAILPVALGMGLIQTSTRLLPRLLAALLMITVIFWVILSGSRSGTLAVLITCLTFALISLRSWKAVIGYAVASSAILAVVFLLLWLLPAGVTSLERIVKNDALSRMLSSHALNLNLCDKGTATTAKTVITKVPEKVITVRNNYKKGLTIDENRQRNWKIALQVFLEHPLGGSGFRTSTDEVLARVPDTKVTDMHSGYLTVLSEAGLLGTIPLAALLACALVLLFRHESKISGKTIIWKTAFCSALTGMLAANLTASYLFERHLWVVLAFAAVIEVWKRDNMDEERC